MSDPNPDSIEMRVPDSLLSRVSKWLLTEGYPTEFEAASIFYRHGFRVIQGEHVRQSEGTAPREVDVVAWADHSDRTRKLVRCEYVVECKWSKDKPWVVFSSKLGRMAPSACITQTISSFLGETVCWHLAGEAECKNMSLFQTPDQPGFGGRQAFTKGQDLFYSAMSSVTSAATNLMSRYDENRRAGTMPDCCVVAFPIIVVDGELFEASFSEELGRMEVNEVKAIRCHWRGAPTWEYHASVDVVTLQHLDQFLAVRDRETKRFLSLMNSAVGEISTCFRTRSLRSLNVKPGPRGVTGLPPLLREIARSTDQEDSKG